LEEGDVLEEKLLLQVLGARGDYDSLAREEYRNKIS
jgi:hypothetical protein